MKKIEAGAACRCCRHPGAKGLDENIRMGVPLCHRCFIKLVSRGYTRPAKNNGR
ncbi:MAG: hypothetical protein ACOY31_09740 [Bacillota bacterium]